MDIIFERACEPQRWTIVFHRNAANRFFSIIAMGHFKHVSAFAWVPEVRKWVIYDPGFPRARFAFLPDTPDSKRMLGDVIRGNCMVTMTPRDGGFPLIRLGYCTSSIKHLLGLRGGALRPDALFRLCVANGGTVSDDENHRTASPAARSPAPAAGRSAIHGAADRG